MIVPTLAAMIDDKHAGRAYFDPYQNGQDEHICLCDTAVCHCQTPMNGIIVRVGRIAPEPAADDLFSDLPF